MRFTIEAALNSKNCCVRMTLFDTSRIIAVIEEQTRAKALRLMRKVYTQAAGVPVQFAGAVQ